jgi:hypothetical protein
MRGASLRSVAELLGHTSMKMTMRYAHLSPAFLSAEVSLLDPPKPPSRDNSPSAGARDVGVPRGPDAAVTQTSLAAEKGKKAKRARKGQSESFENQSRSEVPDFVREFGSPHWTISATGSSWRPRKSACPGDVRQGFASGEACGSEKASGGLAPANSSNAASNRPVVHVLYVAGGERGALRRKAQDSESR